MAKTTRGMQSSVVFLITFLVFLLLFGGIMVWGVWDFWQQRQVPAEDPPITTTTTDTTAALREHRVLLITEQAGEAQGFVVLSAETGLGRVRVVPVPRETVVTRGVTQTRLFELYKETDVVTLTAAVGDLLGFELEKYAVLTYDNLQQLITYLGDGVIYTLPEAVSYQNAAGSTVTMNSGARTLSAVQVIDLFNYTDWHGGRRARADIQGEIAAALLDQYLVASRFDEQDTAFHKIINWTRSNILTSDFVAARSDLLALSRRNEFNISVVTRPRGEFIGVGVAMRFEMAEDPLG